MILKFPDLTTLRLALTSGAIPPAVAAAPAAAGTSADGGLWVETASALPRAAQGDLKKLGVLAARAADVDLPTRASCWAELLPLRREAGAPALTNQTPVLFELAGGAALAELVSEILRLGNDRQSFRWLEDAGGDVRVLLRVVGPPYYSLLRAADGNGRAPTAFVERAPRVWVELGYQHPLGEHLQSPKGKTLLLKAPQRWTLLDDAPYRDVYDVLEFTMPAEPVARVDAPPQQRVAVAPKLKAGGTTDGAEFWVLRAGGFEELNRFVQNSDDHLLQRLAFAVGEKDGQSTFIVRVRQTRQTQPVLVLQAEPYKPYLKLPNLFLPAGMRLQPPLRRDVVRQLLANDPDRVTWLTPNPDGTFTPETLPEDAFRPLSDWVDYVLDRDHQALQAWVETARFDFEPFVCVDDLPAQPKDPPGRDRKRDKNRRNADDSATPADVSAMAPAIQVKKGTVPEEEVEDPAAVIAVEPSLAQKRLKELEERFVALDGGLDSPDRVALWPQMAALYSALGVTEDAATGWMNVLWADADQPQTYAWAWFRVEASAVTTRLQTGTKGRTWASRLTVAGASGRDVSADELDRLLALEEPDGADVRALAAYLVYASYRPEPPPELMRRLNLVQRFLEAYEYLLPVRAVWLAWLHLARLAGNDVLGLARARDRLLGRLFRVGLRPEVDLPVFLRFASESNGRRFPEARQWLVQLCERARQWSGKQGCDALYAGKDARTVDYVDLLFAFGLARLGELDASRQLLQRASASLAAFDDAHQTLLTGFRYRIEQTLAGRPHTGPLPLELLEYMEVLSRERQSGHTDLRYVVDRMRAISRVLEPDQKIDPYRRMLARTDGDLGSELSQLPDLLDGTEVIVRVRALLRKPPKGATGPEARAQILRAGLDQAPRVSEEFGRELLEQVPAAFDALKKSEDLAATIARAELLEKSLFVAAHFDRAELIPHLVSRFQQLVESQGGGTTITAVEALAGQCFRGLRKLGMRDEIDRLLTLMSDVVLQGKPLASLAGRADKPAALRALLHVAGGWYYFGRDARAEPVVKAARAALFGDEWGGKVIERTNLACVYAATLGQAPPEVARRRLEEMFDELSGVRDTFTTNDYYSQSQLKVVEAVVLAVVSDDFTFGAQARRWLDDDEFLVRRRIHRDCRDVMKR